jgi:hypothetical protein
MQKEWEVAHTVTEELVEGPPSRRANATLTACPNGNHLWCVGGEFFSEDGRAVRNFKFITYHSSNITSSISTMTCSDTRQTSMNGGSSFLLRVQVRGLPTPSLPLRVGAASFFFLVRVLSHPSRKCSFFPQEANSHRFIKTRSTTIAISGVSTSRPTPGIGSTPRYAQVRDPDIGECNDRFIWLFLKFIFLGWQFGNIISSFLEGSMIQE